MHSEGRRAAGLVAIGIAALCGGTSASAQVRQFNVPSEDAGKSIPEFARQAQIQVIAPGDQLHGVTTPPVKGPYDIFVALDLMLKGTGLRASHSGGVVTISSLGQKENVEREKASPKLKNSTSILGLLFGFMRRANAGAAVAQDQTFAGSGIEQVVVTGTNIRGIVPVGSNLRSVDQTSIEAIAPVTMTEILNSIPSVSSAGGAPQGLYAGNSFFNPSIHQLAGSASNATLNIVDGMRLPGGNGGHSQVDPNIIPTIALQHVDVLADGASSTYGSDAVAGVINYITRDSYNGVLVTAQDGWGKDYGAMNASILMGSTWEKGGFYIAASHSSQSELRNADRPFLSAGDYRPYGGFNTNSFNCSPATIASSTSSTNYYLSPTASTVTPQGSHNANAPCNTSIYGSALPKVVRSNVYVKGTQQISDRLTVTATVDYDTVNTYSSNQPGSLSAMAYGSGSGKGGQINPFFVAPPGSGFTSEGVNWLDTIGSGPNADNYGAQELSDQMFLGTVKATYRISDSWRVVLEDGLGVGNGSIRNRGLFCVACATLALNGTAQKNGSTTASIITNANIIALNTPLTTANALDVWSPASTNRTSSQVLAGLYNDNTLSSSETASNQMRLTFDGGLFDLPAGTVKAAIGGEIWQTHQLDDSVNSDGTGPTATGSNFTEVEYHRVIYSGFAELDIPVVSPEMNVPFAHKVEVNISGRYDKFSDVGPAAVPKYAVNWDVVDGFRVRANYSMSFVAPAMDTLGDPNRDWFRAGTSTTTYNGIINVPLSTYPTAANIPGVICTATTCQIGTAANPGLTRTFGAGYAGAKPETGNNWSVGMDFAPVFLPGFSANATLFNNTFKGGFTTPAIATIVGSQGLSQRLQICSPVGAPCTAAQVATFANTADPQYKITGAIPAAWYWTIDQSTGNVFNLIVQGIDADVNYVIDTDTAGSFRIGDQLTEFTRFKESFGSGKSQPFSVINEVGYNKTFPSVQTVMRANLGWTGFGFSADMFINFTSGYRNWSNTSVAPIVTDANGNPVSGGDKVNSNTTIDAHLTYNFSEGWLAGDQIYLDGKNVFDKAPPFYSGASTNGLQNASTGYDALISNPIGRVISVGLRAVF